MKIRELQSSDLARLLDLYKDLHTDEPPSAIEDARTSWQSILDNPRIEYFGAFINGELVASSNITIIPNLTRQCRPYGLIENVVTRRDKRRQGIGRTLLEHALDYAWGQGCYKVMLMTGRLEEDTFAFYEAAGFNSHGKQAFVAKP